MHDMALDRLGQEIWLQRGRYGLLLGPNTIWYPVAMHGISRAGEVISGASPAYNIEEMTYALKKYSAKYLMTVPGSIDIAAAAAAAAAKNAGISKENVFLLDGSMAGFKTVKDLIEVGKSFGENGQVKTFNIPRRKKNGDVCAFLSFSSGTTGLPKAVRMRSDKNISSTTDGIGHDIPPKRNRPVPRNPTDNTLHLHESPSRTTPISHHRASALLNLPILLNMEVYMLPAFTMKDMLDAIVEYQI
jgi:4-coumarate--CoA ligase